MTFKQLEYFVAVAKEGSISKASKSLYISQSALSQLIKGLEQEHNVVLFERHNNQIVLTAEGHFFLRAAENILRCKKELEMGLSKRREHNLSVKTIAFYANTLVPYLFSFFKEENPNITFQITEANTPDLFSVKDEANIDLYLHAFDDQEVDSIVLEDDYYCHEIIMEESVLLAASKNNKLDRIAYGKGAHDLPILDLCLLSSETFVVTKNSKNLQDIAYRQCLELGGFKPNIIKRENFYLSLMGHLQFNDWIAFLPESVLKYTNLKSSVLFYNIKNSTVKRKVAICYVKSRQLSAIAQSFIIMAKKILS